MGKDIMERIRYARDRALEAEQTERQRITDADNEELQRGGIRTAGNSPSSTRGA